MSIDLESPKHIYSSVAREVDEILKKLGASSTDEQVSKAQNQTREVLGQFQAEINEHIAALEGSAEWDKFTIAFYGETNAGKSTIIETLRIMLNERSKVETQAQYKALQAKAGLTEENFAALLKSSQDSELLLADLESKLAELVRFHDDRRGVLVDEVSRLQQQVADKKASASLWQKLLNLFRKLPEEHQQARSALALDVAEAEGIDAVEHLKKQQREAQQQKGEAELERTRLEQQLNQLDAFADGGIIGNGSSDFTLDTQDYEFRSGEQQFVLLDVPGIEGKEAKVIDSIWSAVRKAHAVFYVTGKAAAPQKGEGANKGTLEKIKEHLGAQTEVWTLFNKRVTNPMMLRGDLVSADELASLDDLNSKMREQLGDNYQKVIPLSAQPAFLAVADCLPPGSPHAKNKAKFLANFTMDEVLHKTNIQQFHQVLTGDLVSDYKHKIRRSNFNKANQVVMNAKDEFDTLRLQSFMPLRDRLKEDVKGSCDQLDISLKGLKTRLETQGEQAINTFKNTVRRHIYERIERDISNDSFKAAFETLIQEGQATLEAQLPKKMEAELQRFQADIADVIERFQQYASELLEAYAKVRVGRMDTKFDLKIDIDNGLKVKNLLITLGSGALLFWNPAGWVILALGIAGVLFGAGKAVIGFFSSDYKMAQQRKSVDENLDKITAQLRHSMRDSLADAFPELEKKVEGLKDALAEPVRQVSEINNTLVKSIAELNKLSTKIELAGAK
ncbi:hypothetical protein JFU58_13410 [Pseudomonas sp. TH34]|jgi:hypothetical protein|uniref:hypothetical protein n=1 Tax=Pseudomonas sp. TH34 TaxID=2796399 RepID=UPI001912BABA|nr:hypothetical protein [Pseudomonas sp. TH34]MBK5409535.1 hypothetical protein [Pseudomonas sp. TH34]